MKYGFLGMAALASLIAGNGPAAAAPPVIYNWTGFYVGGNLGYSWGSSSTVTTFENGTNGALLSSDANRFDMDGVIGGGQFGYNWQREMWVFGVEADIQGSGQRGNSVYSCAGGTLPRPAVNGVCAPGHIGDNAFADVAAFPVIVGLDQKLDWFGTVRGRIGATVTPNILFYATGGLAYGNISSSAVGNGVNITGQNGTNPSTSTPVSFAFSGSSTRVGWTVGVGGEAMIGGNWSAKFEYLYMDFGTVSLRGASGIVTPTGAFLVTGISSRVTDNILRVGVNYHFNGPGR